MITKKSLLINNYFKMISDLKLLIGINIFPDFEDSIDILFYFNYNFIKNNEYVQAIDDILEINKIIINDELFEKVCDIIIQFINLLKSL